MKIKITIWVLFWGICTSLYAQKVDFSYKRTISEQTDQWHKIILPQDIFKKVNSDFSDLRVLGITSKKDTIEAPYLIKICQEEVIKKEVPFKLINTVKNDKGYYYTFELNDQMLLNHIHFDFKNKNFDFKIVVEGSQDQTEWFSIIEEYRMLSIHNEATDFSFTDVQFADAKYKYIRVCAQTTVNPELIKANLVYQKKVEGSYDIYSPINIHAEEDKRKRETHITIDLEEPVSVCALNLRLSDDYDYYRPITIQYLSDSVNTEKGWKYHYTTLTSGTLNSFFSNEFVFNSTVLKKMKIIIDNKNNAPLHIKDVIVKGYVHEMLVRFTEPAQYVLVYGDKKAVQPVYDIAYFSDKIPVQLTRLMLGEEEQVDKVAIVKEKPLFENRAWLWGIMVVMILLIGYFSISMLKGK